MRPVFCALPREGETRENAAAAQSAKIFIPHLLAQNGLNDTSIQTQRAYAGKELSFGTVYKAIRTLSREIEWKAPGCVHSLKKPRSASFSVYLDLSATCPLGRVAPGQCKCYFELDFRKMTVAEVKRQFGNFVSASGAYMCLVYRRFRVFSLQTRLWRGRVPLSPEFQWARAQGFRVVLVPQR